MRLDDFANEIQMRNSCHFCCKKRVMKSVDRSIAGML